MEGKRCLTINIPASSIFYPSKPRFLSSEGETERRGAGCGVCEEKKDYLWKALWEGRGERTQALRVQRCAKCAILVFHPFSTICGVDISRNTQYNGNTPVRRTAIGRRARPWGSPAVQYTKIRRLRIQPVKAECFVPLRRWLPRGFHSLSGGTRNDHIH